MAIWNVNMYAGSQEIEYQLDLPENWDEQEVYDFIHNDIEIDLTKED